MRNSKRIKIVAGGTAALFGVGVAFAAWTSTGEGTGAVGAAADTTMLVSGAVVTGLYPTATQTMTLTITNRNPYYMEIDSITYKGTDSNTVTKASGVTDPCTASVVSAGTVAFDADEKVAPNGTLTATVPVTMSNLAEDGCKLATFTLGFGALGSSTTPPPPPAG